MGPRYAFPRLSDRLRLRNPRSTLVRAKCVVALADAFDTGTTLDDKGPKWVQVTREGNFPGYLGGTRPFAFTRADLQKMVDNVRAHPAYKVDAAGNPTGHVIPWDFNHASEQDPTTGNLPAQGAPSQGWTLDMEIREGSDGNAELWALTQFLEPARSYVKAGQYKWASVAVQFGAIDPVSGQNVGAVVTSIALTNTPFVEGMETLVASKVQKTASVPGAPNGQVQAKRYFYEHAKDPSDAVSCLKELFGLPETAGIGEVMAQIQIVASWFAADAAPLGTDPEYILASMRTILNLPVLLPDADVLAEASKAIQLLITEQTAASGTLAPTATSGESGLVPPTPVAATKKQSNEDPDMTLAITLSKLLGTRDTEEAILARATELVELAKGLKDIFKLSNTRDTAQVMLSEAKDGAQAKEKLLGLFTALGVEDPDKAVARVAEVMTSAEQLKAVMPELEGLRKEKVEKEEKEIEDDVDQAIAASKLSTNLRPTLKLYRKQDPAGFAKDYPKAPAGQPAPGNAQLQRLTTPLSVSADGTGVSLGRQAPAQQTPAPAGQGTINLGMYPGANPTARAKAYLSTVTQGWDKLDNDAQWTMAVNLRKQPGVIDQAAS